MNLRQKIIRGLTWTGISQVVSQACQFVITATLAHLLSPSDFGLLGMATVFTGFASIFGELGISGALIQNQNVVERHYSSAFWLNVLVGIGLTVIFVLLSPLIANFYGRPELKSIVAVLSLNFFLSSFTIVQQATLTKSMDFKSLALRDILAVISSGATGIFCAYRGYGVWSLVIQLLMYTVTDDLLLWLYSKWRPRWIFNVSSIKEIFPFSAHLTGFQVVNYFARNVDNLLVGKVLGSQALGYYSLAYKLMMFPIQNFTWVINKVMFPAFSIIQNEIERIRKNYLMMIKAVALLSFPLMAYLFVTASDIIQLVFGDRWLAVVPVVKVFCFCGMIQSITSLGGSIYLAKGRSDIQFIMVLISTSALSIVLLVFVRYGIEIVALSYTFFYMLWMNVAIFVVTRLISLNIVKVYKIVWIPFVISIVLAIIATGANRLVMLDHLARAIIFGIVGFATYAILILLTKQVIIKGSRQIILGGIWANSDSPEGFSSSKLLNIFNRIGRKERLQSKNTD